MNRLLLHVGTHKTGSTALQRTLDANRATLWRHGYVLSSALDPTQLARPELDEGAIDAARKRLAAAFSAARGAALLVSSEAFSGDIFRGYPDTGTIVSNLCRTIDGCETTVVVYLRRQDQLLESAYAQSIKQGGSHSFEEFRSRLNETAFDWHHLLRALERVAGRSQVVARVYEKQQLAQGDVVADFCGLAGLPVRELRNPRLHPNPSLGLPALEFARVANRSLPAVEQRALRALLEATSAKRPFASFTLLSPEQRTSLLARHEPGNQQVAREWLGREDGRLFLDPVAAADTVQAPGASMDDVVSVVAAALVAPRPGEPAVRVLRRLKTLVAAAGRQLRRVSWWVYRLLRAPGRAGRFGDASRPPGWAHERENQARGVQSTPKPVDR